MNCTHSAPSFATPNPLYLSEIKDDALLSASEEKALAEAIARGDRDAKNRMIRANLRLVVKIAREYLGRGLMLDDLIGEGNLGLIRAAEEYDPRFGTRFSTYASYWIKQAIRHALINTTSTIRIPAHMVGLMTKWRRLERSLSRRLGYTPSADEVASRLGLTETQKSLIAKAHRASRLKLESAYVDDGDPWSATTPDDSPETPESRLEADEDRTRLARRLERLDAREQRILNYRFGLDGETPLTLKEVGKRLGVTREWVRKIEIRALRKLSDEDFDEIVPAKRRAGRSEPTEPAAALKTRKPRRTAAGKSRPTRTEERTGSGTRNDPRRSSPRRESQR